jgi:sugar phosphate isomerase/epimerase
MQAIRDIGFSGYANLETDAPSKQLEADMRKNLAYIREVIARS